MPIRRSAMLILAASLAASAAAGCAPGPLSVPPKLGISRVDKDASELHISAPQDMFADDTAETLVQGLAEQMARGPAPADGKPARFRARIEHDFHTNIGMVILVALPVIDLIAVPILAATGAEMGTCDDTASVDVQVGPRFYHATVKVDDKGWAFGHNQIDECAHHTMQTALDALQPVDRPPRSPR